MFDSPGAGFVKKQSQHQPQFHAYNHRALLSLTEYRRSGKLSITSLSGNRGSEKLAYKVESRGQIIKANTATAVHEEPFLAQNSAALDSVLRQFDLSKFFFPHSA